MINPELSVVTFNVDGLKFSSHKTQGKKRKRVAEEIKKNKNKKDSIIYAAYKTYISVLRTHID